MGLLLGGLEFCELLGGTWIRLIVGVGLCFLARFDVEGEFDCMLRDYKERDCLCMVFVTPRFKRFTL